MILSTQPYKGARDFYPEDKRLQKYVFGKLRNVVERFGYQEYDAPLLESFDLYAAKSGDEIVNEQLYSFEDKGGRKVAIRPEMTPSVSRMVAARRQELAYPLRLYSLPNLWRYERPQRGRLREHWQLNVDLFGIEESQGDAEIIQVADTIMKFLGAKSDMYKININSRQALASALRSFGVDEHDLKATYKIIDKMPKLDQNVFDNLLSEQLGQDKALKLHDYLKKDQPPEKVKDIMDILLASDVTNAVYEPSVVRGIEYYNDIVFEVFDNDPQNARALFGGGRYDGLIEIFGVDHLPVVGFGMGDVSLNNFLQTHNLLPQLRAETDAIAILIGDVYKSAQPSLKELRDNGVKLAVDSSNRKIDSQIKHAAKSGVRYVIFIGEKEISEDVYKLRDLQKGEEKTLDLDQIVRTIKPTTD
jgi:histidyl-tRNA synthetase